MSKQPNYLQIEEMPADLSAIMKRFFSCVKEESAVPVDVVSLTTDYNSMRFVLVYKGFPCVHIFRTHGLYTIYDSNGSLRCETEDAYIAASTAASLA